MQKCWIGSCREYCDFIVYLFRTLGIPAARDYYKYSPEVRHGHEWNVVKDTTGRFIPIEIQDTVVRRDWVNKRKKGKVYRSYFDKQQEPVFGGNYHLRDVTEEYFGKNHVPMAVKEKKAGFIAVFAFEGWMPIGRYEYKAGEAFVENIEPEVIMMPVVGNGSQFRENGFPFMWNGEETVVFEPDTVKKEKVKLSRKYPTNPYLRNHLYHMNGTHLEGSNYADCVNAEVLAVIQDSTLELKRFLKVYSERKCRYIKLCSPPKEQLDYAELYIYADTAFSELLNYKIVESSVPAYDAPDWGIDKAVDGDWLTFYLSHDRGVSLIMDLGKPMKVGGFVFVPHNDDNFVKKGECYELLYQNGADGWASLGKKIAEDDFIEFEGVPSNALLRLHNCTKGVEEQIFLWKDGKQHFLGDLR